MSQAGSVRPQVRIGKKIVGEGHPCYVIAEIGINHNGDIDVAKRLIGIATAAGCDAVKFQKRTPEICVPAAQREVLRETPWGLLTYMEYRKKVEFGQQEYECIDACCREAGLQWFSSCWDDDSIDFMERFDPPCYKVASASLTDLSLLRKLRGIGKRNDASSLCWNELDRLPVTQRDRSGLIEQECIHVSRGFNRFSAHCQNIVLHDAVHTRDPDRREQATDGGRDQAHQQRNENRDGRCSTASKCRD